MLEELRELNRNIHNAMLIVEYFHAVLDKKSVKSFRKALESWYRLVKESNLKPFRDFAKLIRKYRLNIEAYVRSGLTTAVSEGINNKIKVLKRMGYGYTNQKSFETRSYSGAASSTLPISILTRGFGTYPHHPDRWGGLIVCRKSRLSDVF